MSRHELETETTIHEDILLTLAALADTKGLEIRLDGPPEPPLTQFLVALLGFLRDDHGALIRPPMNEIVQTRDCLEAVQGQIHRIMRDRCSSGDRC